MIPNPPSSARSSDEDVVSGGTPVVGPTEENLARIEELNPEGAVEIHTARIGEKGEEDVFLRALAGRNGGEYLTAK